MTGIQILLIVVVVLLTALLVLVGVQVFLAIMDLRKAVKRLNSILEDAILGGGLIRPHKLTGVLEMFKSTKSVETLGTTSEKPSQNDPLE